MNSKALLVRTTSTPAGTFGKIYVGKVSFFTGELPWRENKPGRSCIPCGVYPVVWEYSEKFGRHLYELKNVWGRSEIKIHPANFFGDKDNDDLQSEVDGCIGLGKIIREVNGQTSLLQSKAAVTHLEQIFAGQPWELEIKNAVSVWG